MIGRDCFSPYKNICCMFQIQFTLRMLCTSFLSHSIESLYVWKRITGSLSEWSLFLVNFKRFVCVQMHLHVWELLISERIDFAYRKYYLIFESIIIFIWCNHPNLLARLSLLFKTQFHSFFHKFSRYQHFEPN